MSFSGDVKREISRITDAEDSVQLAELIAILRYQDCIYTDAQGAVSIRLNTENTALAKRMFLLVKDHVSTQPAFAITDKKATGKARRCRIRITEPADVQRILTDTGLVPKSPAGERHIGRVNKGLSDPVKEVLSDRADKTPDDSINKTVSGPMQEERSSLQAVPEQGSWRQKAVQDADCRRAYIRGAYLSAGSVSDPGKSYHCEIICPDDPHRDGGASDSAYRSPEADFLLEQLDAFGIAGRTTIRKGKTLVYLKESTAIVDLLNVIGAHQSLMRMENVRILKEMKNSANRQVNCDNANINKIVKTAGRQIEDIRLIEERIGLKSLPESLKQAAEARLAYPEISLQELGTYLDPPVGKSGVNHRLRKIAAIAQKLREADPS